MVISPCPCFIRNFQKIILIRTPRPITSRLSDSHTSGRSNGKEYFSAGQTIGLCDDGRPRSMKRRRILAVTNWCAAAILTVLAIFSFFVGDQIEYKPAYHKRYEADFRYGHVAVNISELPGEPRLIWKRFPLEQWYRSRRFVRVERDVRFMGVGYVQTETSKIICIPIWLPIGLLIIMPVRREMRLWRMGRRVRKRGSEKGGQSGMPFG